MVTDVDGEAVILLCTCSPEGQLMVVDQIYAKVSPEALYQKYKQMIGGRRVISVQVPADMFKERRHSGKTKAQAYNQAGFRFAQNPCDYAVMLPVLASYFSSPPDSKPKLTISPKCKRLLWELYNALDGELKSSDRKSIQALLLWLAMGPKWRDMKSEPVRTTDEIDYPDADVP